MENQLAKGWRPLVNKVVHRHEFNLICALAALCILFSIAVPTFFTPKNILSVLNQNSMVFIIAVGTTVILILGGMDLSSGYTACFAGILTVSLISKGLNMWLAIFLGLCTGAVIGFLNGYIITKLQIVDFIVTLGSMSVVHGAIFAYTNGYSIYENIPKAFLFIGQGKIGGVLPVTILLAAGAYTIGSVMLGKTRLGTYIYAAGCNREAARLSGINVNTIRRIGYMFSGIMCAVAGIIAMSRLGSGQPTAGDSFLFDAVGAAVLGGTNMNGGEGTVFGTLIGVLVIGVISNGLTMIGISYYYQEIVKGGIIILAVAYNAYRAKRKG